MLIYSCYSTYNIPYITTYYLYSFNNQVPKDP